MSDDVLHETDSLQAFINDMHAVVWRNMFIPNDGGDLIVSNTRLQFLTDMKFGTRIHLLDEQEVRKLWLDTIRQDTDINDFVDGVLQEIKFLLNDTNKITKLVYAGFSSMLAPYTSQEGATPSVHDYDQDYFKSLMSRENAKKLLSGSPWLVVILVFKLLNYNYFLAEVGKIQPPSSKKRQTKASQE